ncbi:MAG: MFS transporter [Firmicutes bacterium]|nr:MFS transporter [Alicyclobacillaceae bacterium]MCL6496346.1 MFS transporter [Bacillota bacterium]
MDPVPGVVMAAKPKEERPWDLRARLGILTTAHAVTHMRGSLLPLLYPVLMRQMGFGYAQLGLMLSITRLFGGLLQGIWGPIAQRVPGKVLIALENLGVSLGIGMVGVSHNLPELTGAVTFGQVAASPHHPIASSLLSRWFGKSGRGHALSVHFAGGNFATVLSPLVATLLLTRLSWQTTLDLFMIPGVVVAGLVWWRLPGEVAQGSGRTERGRWRQLGELCQPLRDAKVRRLIATGIVTAGGKGLGVLQTFVPLLFVRALHLGTVATGFWFTAFTATSVVGPLLLGRLSDRFDRPKFLSVLLAVSFVLTVALALGFRSGTVAAVALVVAMGMVVHAYGPVEQAILGDLTEAQLPEQAYSLFYGLTFGASAFWPLVLGVVLSRWGFTWLFLVIAATYLAGAWIYGTQDWRPTPA